MPSSSRGSEFTPISVIVITCNEEENIRECLESLLSQDYPPDRYEIVNVDASTDSTPVIVSQFPSVQYTRSEKGFSQQKNKGVAQARYRILAFTDADCIIPAGWLRTIHDAFQDENLAGIGGNAYPPPGTGHFGMCVAAVGHPGGGAIGLDANVFRTTRGVDFVPGCNSAFRKEALQKVGGFDPDFRDGGEDVDLSRRLIRAGYKLDYISELTVYHKPRMTLPDYVRWNIGVGITKYNLKQPHLAQVVMQPSFPGWSLLLGIGFLWIFLRHPLAILPILLAGWLLALGILFLFARPYPLLLKRRKKIGIDLFSVLVTIPILVYIRQVCINIGQIKKWKHRRERSRGDRSPLP